MRTAGLVLVLLIVLLAPGIVMTAPAPEPAVRQFSAILSGDEQVPRVTTRAFGRALFELNPAGTAITYWLDVVDIENVEHGHIHIGAAGQNGPIAVWLYPSAPPPRRIAGMFSGELGSGTFTAANFVGPLARQPMSALVTALTGGNAYANVHTVRNPGGEIRGLIR